MNDKKQWLPPSIFALFAVRLVVSAGSFVGPFLAMMLTIKLEFNEARAGVFMAAVSVVSAFGLALGGKLGDSFGRADVLRGLQALTALAFIACGIIGFTSLTPYLIALAMGTLSGTWPVINALVADRAPENRRKEAFSLLYWGNNIGFSIGPLIAGFLFDKAPRALFFGNAAALLIAAAVVSAFVRGKDPVHDEPAGAVKPALESERDGAAELSADAGSAGAAGLPGDAAAAVDAAVSGDAARKGGLAKSSLLSVLAANPVLVLYGLSSILVAFVYNQHTFALPLFLKDLLGPVEGPKAYGWTMMANGLSVVILTLLVTLASKRMAALSAVALGSVFYALGFGGYYFAVTLPLVLAMTVLWTIGEILGATNGNAFIAERAPPAYRSRINSVISLCYIVGNTASPLVAGPLVRRFGAAALWPVIAALSLASALLIFGVHAFDGRGQRRAKRA